MRRAKWLALAEECMREILQDDELWQRFVAQMNQHGLNVPANRRQEASENKEFFKNLSLYHLDFGMRHICDWRDHNPKLRPRSRSYDAKRRYYCRLGTHTDPTTPPPWLDEEQNLCPHFYQDLTRA